MSDESSVIDAPQYAPVEPIPQPEPLLNDAPKVVEPVQELDKPAVDTPFPRGSFAPLDTGPTNVEPAPVVEAPVVPAPIVPAKPVPAVVSRTDHLREAIRPIFQAALMRFGKKPEPKIIEDHLSNVVTEAEISFDQGSHWDTVRTNIGNQINDIVRGLE